MILDRDGTLIVERNYLSRLDGVELLPEAAVALRRFKELGWGRLIVTNQSGIGRGYFTRDTLKAIHVHMTDLFARSGAEIDGVYVCPHTPEDDCECRKPKAGLVYKAAADWGFTPSDCVFIGDKACDIELGRGLGATTILVLTGYGKEHYLSGLARPEFVAEDLSEAVEIAERTSAPSRNGPLSDSSDAVTGNHNVAVSVSGHASLSIGAAILSDGGFRLPAD